MVDFVSNKLKYVDMSEIVELDKKRELLLNNTYAEARDELTEKIVELIDELEDKIQDAIKEVAEKHAKDEFEQSLLEDLLSDNTPAREILFFTYMLKRHL